MNNPLGLRIVTTTLAGVMTIAMVACNKPADATNPPPPATTIGTELDDSVVTTRVKAVLLEDADVKSFDIKVETHKGEVMLSGFVDNPTQMDRAIAITRTIQGVKNIDNKLSLKSGTSTAGNKVDDTVITAKVKAALLGDSDIKSSDIKVATHQGEVQLSGFVNNQAQIVRAVEITRTIEGVTQVGNEMSIKK
jgi:hyperosmotically inducible protein